LIGDYTKKAELSTFLASGEILLKVGERFMIFDKQGNFKDEVEYQDLKEEESNNLKDK